MNAVRQDQAAAETVGSGSPRPSRLSLPSKGRLAEESIRFLEKCGLQVYKPNPRQYEASLPALPGLVVLFQRPADIAASVRDGSVDFGITGLDVIAENQGDTGQLLVLHEALGFGGCALTLAVPEGWSTVGRTADLPGYAQQLGRPLGVATRYPRLVGRYLEERGVPHTLIGAEGTLETAPAIGYADLIADLVSSGQTLRDNRLRPLPDGVILSSQAALIANKRALQTRPRVQDMARFLLEYFEAHLRASENLAVFANIRGDSPEVIAQRLFAQATIGGLQGPTVSRMIVRDNDPNWYDVHIIVRRDLLFQAITELRQIGGSGVVVTPVTYIFDEEPPRYQAMLAAIREPGVPV
jgi:ATP phosphoribosyltransferase